MQKCTGLYNYGVRLSKLKLILGVLITSLFTSSCSSDPIDSITGSGEIENIKLSESGTKLQKSIDNVEDMCTLFTNLSEYVYWSSIIGKGSFSSQEETKIKKYIISLELISSLDQNYKPGLNESLQDLWPTINDGYLPPLDKITLLIEIFHPGCVYSEIMNSGSVAESQPENTQALGGNREACRIYDETMAEAMQLPFGSPKLSYILDNGYTKAMRYADADLALNFQILIDGKPGSSNVIFDVNEICDQYR